MRRRRYPGPGSRTTGGGGGGAVMVSRAIAERERVRDENLLSVVRENTGPKILVHGT
jgi:galactokinase